MSKKSVTRKDLPDTSAILPCPYDLGQSVGTALWMALRDSCSPANMVSASLPLPLFMKYCMSSPLGSFVVILDAVAEESPPPPPPETDVLLGSRPRRLTIALSSFIVLVQRDLRWGIRGNIKRLTSSLLIVEGFMASISSGCQADGCDLLKPIRSAM
ncbi:hypothetical protein KC333_g20 [Hortaea werneckii]|nr:hypothetical protein KC333_g20 [Hortaea werneckii]